MAGQRLMISLPAPTELTRLCVLPFKNSNWIDGVLLTVPAVHFFLHSLLLVRDHVKMVEEEWLYYGAFKCYPKERIVLYVLQIWLLFLIITLFKALEDEEEILDDENE